MTSTANEKVSELSKAVGPFFLTSGALNHPVISADSQNKCTEKNIDIPMIGIMTETQTLQKSFMCLSQYEI